jgi:HD-like signal output (HDOD) protein
MSNTPQQIIKEVEGLLSLPEAVISANQLLNSRSATARQVGEVISHDPALSAQLLKLVNSAFYGFSSPIDTISRAVTVIGNRELRSLILSASVATVFDRITPQLIDMDDFWHRSVYAGLVAKRLAENRVKGKRETLFITGLLHDIGKIVLFTHLPERASEILAQAADTGLPLHQIEQERLNFTTAELGAELLESWNLGENLWLPIRYQRTPERATGFETEAWMLYLAIALTDCVEPELKSASTMELTDLEVDPEALQSLGLSIDDLYGINQEVNLECLDVLQIINPKAATSTRDRSVVSS